MKKSIIIAIIILSVISLAVYLGIYLFKLNNTRQYEPLDSTEIATEKRENNVIKESIVQANSNQEKITPTTNLILKKYYTDCGHVINSYVMIPQEIINMTKDELQEEYPQWSIEKFSVEEVILLKEESGFCNEHFILREKDGVIVVYSINKQGDEILKEETDISTELLPQGDVLNLRNGITIYGEEELNKTLEDYE